MRNKMISKELNEKLYWEKLKQAELTQKELAKIVNENEKTFSAYIKSGNFHESKLIQIASLLNTSIDNLWIEVEDLNDKIVEENTNSDVIDGLRQSIRIQSEFIEYLKSYNEQLNAENKNVHLHRIVYSDLNHRLRDELESVKNELELYKLQLQESRSQIELLQKELSELRLVT